MNSLYEILKKLVREEIGRVPGVELAVVEEQHSHESESDKDNYACSVRLRNSALVLKQVPVVTSRMGCASIPEVGDLVLVQFVGGDVNGPVITGSLYNDEDRPPENAAGQAVLHLPLGASDDEAVHLEVSSTDSREIALTLGAGLELVLRDDDPVVEVIVDGGSAKVSIARDGALSVECRGDISIKGDASIAIEAAGELNLKGSAINLN